MQTRTCWPLHLFKVNFFKLTRESFYNQRREIAFDQTSVGSSVPSYFILTAISICQLIGAVDRLFKYDFNGQHKSYAKDKHHQVNGIGFQIVVFADFRDKIRRTDIEKIAGGERNQKCDIDIK